MYYPIPNYVTGTIIFVQAENWIAYISEGVNTRPRLSIFSPLSRGSSRNLLA